MLNHRSEEPTLAGCLTDVFVDNVATSLVGSNVRPGCKPTCDSDPCLNGGVCLETFDAEPSCKCAENFSGATCEIGKVGPDEF